MTSTPFTTCRPGRTAQPVGSSRASWIRRFAAGAGAVMVLGGLTLTVAAPAQAAQASSLHLGETSSSGYDCNAPWHPGVTFYGCPVNRLKN